MGTKPTDWGMAAAVMGLPQTGTAETWAPPRSRQDRRRVDYDQIGDARRGTEIVRASSSRNVDFHDSMDSFSGNGRSVSY